MLPTFTAAPHPNAIVFHDKPAGPPLYTVESVPVDYRVFIAATPPSNPDDCGCAMGTVCRQNGNCPRLPKRD